MVTKKATGVKRLGSRFRFFGDTIAELKKVTWPTRQETVRLTVMVLIVCIVIGAFLALVDYGFARLVRDVFIP